MNKQIIICILALASVLLIACTPPANIKDAGQMEEAPALTEDQTLAWVNEKPVAKKQMDEMIEQLGPYVKTQLTNPDQVKMMADGIIGMELIYQNAMAEGYAQREGVKDQIAMMKKQLISKMYLDDAMAKTQSEPDEAAMRKFYDETPQLADKDFETVKGQISMFLSRQNQQEQYQKIIDDLKTNANVRYNDAVLDSFASASAATISPEALKAMMPETDAEKTGAEPKAEEAPKTGE